MSNVLSGKRVTYLLLALTCSFSASLLADDSTDAPKQSQPIIALPSDSKIAIESTDSDQEKCTPTPQNPQPQVAVEQKNNQTADEPIADTTEPEKTVTTPSLLVQESSIAEIKNGGKVLIMDNGMTFEVPTVLKKRCASWQVKDKIFIERGRRNNWYKLINTTRNEKVRVRLQTAGDVK